VRDKRSALFVLFVTSEEAKIATAFVLTYVSSLV
jgi:hypothetical protein